MKKLKQTLALALVVCMLCSCLPVGALASGNTADNATALESNEAVIQATSALTPAEPNRPEDGSTQNQPFDSGTAGSQYFRIPAITTLSNGNLVAAADARWNDIYDKGNIDTLVSVSKDNGANWNYTFANYIDDGGNTFNISAATFIDPAMAVKNVDGVETIYMMADLFPGQANGSTMCINAALEGTGMDANGHLLVSSTTDNSLSAMDHYVGDFDSNNMATLYTSAGADSGYDVDAWFNVYNSNGEHLGNLFTYGDTGFYVYQTSYLVLTKSTDGGKTWSAPTLLNHQVKDATEKFYGVGPASGIVTSDGTIMFTAYTYNGGDGATSTFYYKDNGVTWERGADLNSQSSEAALAEGNNGVVYLFNRYGQVCYTSDYGESWTYLSSVGYATGCEVSALTYSRPIDGKTAILVCGPTSGRYGGKIFVGLINDDNTITWKYNYAVNTTSEPFQYSSMTELADGSIGLLYENTVNTTAGVVYKNIAITDILSEDAVIGTPEKTISLTPGETTSFKLEEVVDSGSHTSDVADVTWTKNDTTVTVPAAQLGTNISYSGDTINLNDCLYTFTKNSDGTWLISADANGTTVYVDPYVYNDGGHPNRTYKTNVTLSDGGNNTVNFKDNTADSTGRTGYLHFWDNSSTNLYWDNCTGNSCTGHDLLIYKVADTSSTTVLGGYFEQVTYDELVKGESGAKYLIVGHTISGYDSDGYYAMRPSTSTSDDDKWDHLAKITGGYTDVTTSETTVKIQAKAIGSTSVEIGSTKYTINVSNSLTNVDVELNVGDSKEFTENSGAYTSATTEPDANVVNMELVPSTTEATIEIGNAVNPVTAGKYVIYTYLGAYVTNKADGNYIDLSATEQTVWNVAVADSTAGTYYITDSDGNYLTVGSGTAGVTSTQTAVKLVYGYSDDDQKQYGFFIQDANGSYNLNNSGGTNNAYGKPSANAIGSWSRWQFKPYTEIPGAASTTVTFTGVATGTTTAVVGNTQYNITVDSKYDAEVDVTLMVGESRTYTDNTGNYQNSAGNVQPNASFATMTVTGTDAVTEQTLKPITNNDGLVAGKQYIVENVRAAGETPHISVLTTEEAGGGEKDGKTYYGLNMGVALNVDTNQRWSITPSGSMYIIGANGEFISFNSDTNITMEPTEQALGLAYVENSGWLIYKDVDNNNTYDDGDYFLSDVYGSSWKEATVETDKDNAGNYWNIYEVVSVAPASTTITFKGVAEGKTTAVVGNTKYNITVTSASEEPFEKEENVMLLVGQNKTHTDPTGNYEASYTGEGLDENIATVEVKGTTVEGSTTVTPVTTLTTDDTFYIQVSEGVYRTANGGTTTNLAEAELWTVKEGGGSYGRLMNEAGDYLIVDNGALTSQTAGNTYFNFDGYTYEIYYQTATVNITVGVPLKINVTEAKDVTDITFTGNSEGTTSVIVGKTRYNITVVSAYDCVTSENSPFVVGGDFIGSVTNDAKNEGMDYLTRLTMSSVMTKANMNGISKGYQIDLSSDFDDAQSISWSIADESIAKIEVSEDGKSVFVTAADANTTGTTYLSCTIDGETYTIPVVIIKTTETTSNGSWKYNSLHIAEITRTDAWYSWNCSGDANQFVKAIEGEAIWTVFDQSEKFCINFYAAPDPDHALTFMSATNSAGEYHTLADKENPKNCDFYTIKGAGYDERTSVGFTDDQVANDIKAALGLGCDGAQGFSRGPGVNFAVNCNLTFISDPVPTIDKTVDGVLPTTRKQANYRRYAENMVASVNEQVYFKITVTLAAPSQWMPYDSSKHAGSVVIDGITYGIDADGNRYSAIVYSDAIVSDYALGTEHAFIYTKDIDNEDGKWDGEIPAENRRQYEYVTDALNAAWTADELAAGKREIPLYLVYTIQESDIPKFEITNTANLNFGFKSHYSTGVTARKADAEAKISVVGTAIDSVVIDFGQKFTYSASSFVSVTDGQLYTFSGLTNVHLKGAYVDGETIGNVTGCKAIAKYGTATVTRTERLDENGKPVLDDKGEKDYLYTVTYTPDSILQSTDTIQIYGIGAENQEKLINSILVYPATTVYYEEGFLENVNNGWSFEADAKKATTDQTFELLGLSQYNTDGQLTGYVSGKSYAYGFDPIYDGITENGEVAPSSISATNAGAAAKFTFTGTGFEIFANCTKDSGFVNVAVNKPDGSLVKMFTVNTVVKGGTGENNGATSGQTGNMDALPIVSLKDLEHGTYTVTLTKVVNDSKTVTIDGVRITNTVSDSSIYTVDLEDSPEFYQLRDAVLHAIGIKSNSSEDYGDLTGKAQQVYNDLLGQYKDENGNIVTDTEIPAAVITDTTYIYGNEKDEKTLLDLLDNGPKNELYLWPGQTLTFKVKTNRTMQVGLKAPSGATGFSANAVGSNPDDDMNAVIPGNAVFGVTDMFYDLVPRPVADTENVYTVTITNIGENILSITDLKVCDDPNATLVPLTLEDVTEILRDAGYTDSEPEAPLPFEDVPADDYFHDSVAWAVKNGITNGISDTRFAPNELTTRAQVVTFLWRAKSCPEPTIQNPFTDVNEDDFYYKAVLWAFENGITQGVTNTSFAPGNNCTRAQAVTFLYRYDGEPVVDALENPFEDISSKDFYYNAILWAVKNGVTIGETPTTFVPDATCTRAQIVTFLYRYMAD